MSRKTFIVVTSDYVGLGFAVKLKQEGHAVLLAVNPPQGFAPSEKPAFERVGDGMVDKKSLLEVFDHRAEYKSAYWIWDFNHSTEINETLRREGFKVLGGGNHCDRMEHDREHCVKFVSEYGLRSPASFAFSDMTDAINHCKKKSEHSICL